MFAITNIWILNILASLSFCFISSVECWIWWTTRLLKSKIYKIYKTQLDISQKYNYTELIIHIIVIREWTKPKYTLPWLNNKLAAREIVWKIETQSFPRRQLE